MINVLFFAQLREQLACSDLSVDGSEIKTTAQLREYLFLQYPQWIEFLNNKKLLVAVNQTLVKDPYPLGVNDEVAFFPPVTGG